MTSIRRKLSILAVTLVAGAAVLHLQSPALAQPGSASARGLGVDLSATVGGLVVIEADAVIGSAVAPAGGGTDTSTLVDISLTGATGVTASGTVEEVTATRGATESSAFSAVTDLNLTVLGIDVIQAPEATAVVTCPLTGAQTAETTLAEILLFGQTVVLTANGPSVQGSGAVAVPGLLDAALNATLTRTETTTADGAAATAILAALTLTGTVAGEPVTIPVGTVVVAQATCERPLAPAPPTSTAIDPDSGPQSGGQTVTITGTNFVPGQTTVTFDGVPATDVTVAPGGTTLTAVTPANPIGPADVVVTTPGGSAEPLDYTYLADGSDATFTGLTPPSGPTSGGTTVTITGTGLTGAIAVDFNGLPSTDFTIDPAGTTITVVTPPNPAGPALVEVIFPAGRVTAPTFSYVAPTITSIVPDTGPSAGGTRVTITGTGFTDATGVTFDDNPGTDLVVDPSGTSLTVTTPPGPPGPVDVLVLIPGADAAAPGGFTYQAAAPTTTAIDPDSGPQSGGQTVTITGTNFVPGQTTVTLDGVPATDVTVAPGGTTLTAVTPANPIGPADVVVTTPGGSAEPLDYTYLADGSDAVVTGLDPTSGPTSGGTTVTITGTGFTGATGVSFDGVAGTGFTVDPAGTTITVVTPPNAAGPADVSLVFPAGTAAGGTFGYIGPTVTSVSPPAGPSTGGTRVTVTGTGLTGATGVDFGGNPGTDLVVDPDGTSLTVTTPPGTPGTVDVTVLLPGADAVAEDGFDYQAVAPVINTVDPGQGPTVGGPVVTVGGIGFVPGQTTVTICGRTIPAGEVTVSQDGTSLTFRAPACPPGDTAITVGTPGGVSNTLFFRYVGVPPLPVTGDPVRPLIGFSAAVTALGIVLLLSTRRRRTGDPVG
ncbi:IPT/TIG domain-containing protein [Micromonospora sp. WMMD1102]|uniref:IPT/TIG domain-containing protein n=1 Tax=Micromonospora sp. WMMD1102 TaxID=3016105 RepID=UPI0024154FB5|nr:IPT/TIG domain-containing protein [Micromonospora sp. WMMD1102]MDG4786571.1 IPT/TIG domain-containing protein [Micromonospora sp. WMMD1102]